MTSNTQTIDERVDVIVRAMLSLRDEVHARILGYNIKVGESFDLNQLIPREDGRYKELSLTYRRSSTDYLFLIHASDENEVEFGEGNILAAQFEIQDLAVRATHNPRFAEILTKILRKTDIATGRVYHAVKRCGKEYSLGVQSSNRDAPKVDFSLHESPHSMGIELKLAPSKKRVKWEPKKRLEVPLTTEDASLAEKSFEDLNSWVRTLLKSDHIWVIR